MQTFLLIASSDSNVVASQVSLESSKDDDKSLTPYEKFADGFDSNGFVSALMTYNKNNGVSQSGNNSSVLYDFDLSTLSQILESNLDDSSSGLMVSSNTVNVSNSLLGMGNEMDKLMDQTEMSQQNNNNNNETNSLGVGSTSNNNNNSIIINGSSGPSEKLTASEEIDCVVESWTSVKRMNALDGAHSVDGVPLDVQEIVEIAEIIPTSPKCNQLLVKLQRTKAPETEAAKIIMATVAKEEEEQHNVSMDQGKNTFHYKK